MSKFVRAARLAGMLLRARLHVRRPAIKLARTFSLSALIALPVLASPSHAGLRKSTAQPVSQFGFSTAGQIQKASEFLQFFNVTSQVLGAGAVVRTGLGWDPAKQNVPGFNTWNDEVLTPALSRGITVLPGIRTLDLANGGYRMPTDAQWAYALRQIVRMYGPNGVYQKGGTYTLNGKVFSVAPHPGFKGLTDYELWNEPNTQGNLKGAMTPARITALLRVGSAAMRDQARIQGFAINVVGPAIGGIDLSYVKALHTADPKVFSYIGTLSVHAYTRFAPTHCDAFGPSKIRCIRSFEEIRKYLDANGGKNVRLGTTEGGIAGDRGTCIGPQVRTEQQQRDYTLANLVWLRDRPWLKFDFWITPNPLDGTRKYSYACDSGKYDVPYWEDKLGVMRPDLSWKPWGLKYRDTVKYWRSLATP